MIASRRNAYYVLRTAHATTGIGIAATRVRGPTAPRGHTTRPYDRRMDPRALATMDTLQRSLGAAGRAGLHWSASWWQVLRVGALVIVLALAPSTYERANRRALAHHIVVGTLPLLAWFAVLSALVSVVLIRIVIVTAAGYGLDQYALEMVVRVLVLELIPLTAALFVALRATLPSGAELSRMHARGQIARLIERGVDPLRRELMPRVVAGVVAVALLAALNCLIALVLAYLLLYGPTTSALPGFTRAIGQIFGPGVMLILALKTLLFALAVSLVPVAALLRAPRRDATRTGAALDGLVRMFLAILLIEVGSLVGNYT
jgi:phospholipid/cholesterol/gamma-HCH transport system permease protein